MDETATANMLWIWKIFMPTAAYICTPECADSEHSCMGPWMGLAGPVYSSVGFT